MTTKVAPWLEGLGDAWELPSDHHASTNISSATHNASSLRSTGSRIPKRSLSGFPSSARSGNTFSPASTRKSRDPLSALSSNDVNTLRRQDDTTAIAATRSLSNASNQSFHACGTVQQRSKSASPSKKQETLEWKRRLVKGQIGYGDQTDLFGPSGLENIFAKSKGAENVAPQVKKRMSWLPRSDMPMPSSPPPWPSGYPLQKQQEPNSEECGSIVERQLVYPEAEYTATDEDQEGSRYNLSHSQSARSRIDRPKNAHRPHSTRLESDKASTESEHNEAVGNRTLGGQTELEQEDFSPVFISKHTTVSGRVDYAALDSHMIKQFQNGNMGLIDSNQAESHLPDSDWDNSEKDPEQPKFIDDLPSESLAAPPDLSFSENLPTGSPFPNLGQNVEFKRGGYSQYGSFKQRPLSPSQPEIEQSGQLLPLSTNTLQVPAAPTPPKPPSTPLHDDELRSRSSGSPLKLFGAHDTFTNNRLLRRMSQLNPDGTLAVRVSPAVPDGNEDRHRSQKTTSRSSFGKGELDLHAFDAEITITSASDSDKTDSDRSPGLDVPVPGSKTPREFRFEATHEILNTFKTQRTQSKPSGAKSKNPTLESQKTTLSLQPTVEDVSESHIDAIPTLEQTQTYNEGKRPPTSPFKNPTPKRRRTLHKTELEKSMANLNNSYHSQLQEAVGGRKRKDARPGMEQNTAQPEILASRKILRPRNPTPSQRRRQQIEAELREAAEEFAAQEPEKLEAVMEQIESSIGPAGSPPSLQQQARNLASEVAAFTLKVESAPGKRDENGERKRSVTTQDFLNEAMMVMNLIRAKARPQSILGSVEESDAEALGQSRFVDGSQQDDSHLRVSRPPSREGSGWRPLKPAHHSDVRVISHLRKFQEQDERGDETDFIANSIASLQVDDDETANEHVIIVDKDANIRITGPPTEPKNKIDKSDSRPQSQRSQPSTVNTQSTEHSTSTNTGRTTRSLSTRKSDNVGTLGPDAVAHIIGEQVGGMTFDKEKKRWVRVSKSPGKAGHGNFLELPSTVTSDDDPFREISDLPVDEEREMRRISSPEKAIEVQAKIGQRISSRDQAKENEALQSTIENRTSSNETVISPAATRERSPTKHLPSSSAPSRCTAFASSQQEKAETRATSWNDEELAKIAASRNGQQQPTVNSTSKILGDPKIRSHSPPTRQISGNDTTVRYSRHDEQSAMDETSGSLDDLREDTALDFKDSDVEDIDSPKLRQTPFKPQFAHASVHRNGARQVSLRRQTLKSRLHDEAHEQSELSLVAHLPGDRMMSVSLSVLRPLNTVQPVLAPQSSPSKGGNSFLWSDLPEFTVHEEDEDRPSERALAERLARYAAAESGDRFALAVKDLVKTLTEVKEEEPYWEDLKQLDLHSRSLASLHMLDDFCARIQDLDVSNNMLTNLHGAPATIRRLVARSNKLSTLTPWSHLMNLQYLDISGNELDSLDGLSCLIHLRELRADDNNISSIEGIFELDGLLKLRLRRNKIQQIHLEGCYLHRLTDLDLSGNKISFIEGLEQLLSLSELNLDGNNLKRGLPADAEMPSLRSLSMRDCQIGVLDVSLFPCLRDLNVDDNQLASIEGVDKLRVLNVLSMRRQRLPEGVRISIFDRPLEANVVFVSGNAMPSLRLGNSFMNLQHLELASTGLQELPHDFGLRMPNLRSLNLNFNNLKDVRPLLNIHNLERLFLSGNRLNRLRKSVATFSKLSSLRILDLRDNPFTHGFYAPISSTLSKHTSIVRMSRDTSLEDDDEQAFTEERLRYTLSTTDVEADRQHHLKLDEDLKLRRRVSELLLAYSCPLLAELDGLKFDKAKAVVKDPVWDRLLELGIIKRSNGKSDALPKQHD